jgi:hypothetical protein
MGLGDKLMAIGDAWVQYQRDDRKRKVAIGDMNGRRIDTTDQDLTWGLDHFLARQEEVDAHIDVTWINSYPGNRPYIDYTAIHAALRQQGKRITKPGKAISRLGRYIFNEDYRPNPAPIVFTPQEQEITRLWRARGAFVAIEPFVKVGAPPSKQWPVERFHEVARVLMPDIPIYQVSAPSQPTLDGLPRIESPNFRSTMAHLKAAALYIGPEGGLHHASAAVGTRAVVISGGFLPPLMTGYPDLHVNLTGDNGDYACGTRHSTCDHCIHAFDSITVEDVVRSAREQLEIVGVKL